eukprot:4070572-Pleurochrysis_carterae.AAC.5
MARQHACSCCTVYVSVSARLLPLSPPCSWLLSPSGPVLRGRNPAPSLQLSFLQPPQRPLFLFFSIFLLPLTLFLALLCPGSLSPLFPFAWPCQRRRPARVPRVVRVQADVARLSAEREKLMEISNMLRADLNRLLTGARTSPSLFWSDSVGKKRRAGARCVSWRACPEARLAFAARRMLVAWTQG